GQVARLAVRTGGRAGIAVPSLAGPIAGGAWFALVGVAVAYGLWHMVSYLSATLALSDLATAVGYGLFTLARVLVLIALA
ncbi:hypothetical protein, partial [Acinetobacter baumannii]|uniref:hypothetical protein n=1 Tax=Acinetobacter baumannii TaxID=470 RepID=UPI001C089BFD